MLTHARQVHARDRLSEHDMLLLLNFELSAYDECAHCHFASVEAAAKGDWRANLEADEEATEAARRIASHVLDEVHEAYDVE